MTWGLVMNDELHRIISDDVFAAKFQSLGQYRAALLKEFKRHWNPIYNTDPINRACGELPEGYIVRIELEVGAGTIDVFDRNGTNIDFCGDSDGFYAQIHEAIDEAIKDAKPAPTLYDAIGDDLNEIGRMWHMEREADEQDEPYRARIKQMKADFRKWQLENEAAKGVAS